MNKTIILILFLLILASFLIYSQKQKNNSQTAIIAFAGDTMLGRLVNEKISQKSYEYVWGNVLPILKKTDLNIINLETTLTKSTKIVPKVFNFKADPDKVNTLKAARIDVVNLANNHILDFDVEGMQETIETLDKAGIKHVGAGNNLDEAKKPVILDIKGIKIGIIGYTDNEPTWKATKSKGGFIRHSFNEIEKELDLYKSEGGTNYIKISPESIQEIKNDIQNIRNKVDILIVSIHWGPNMRQEPSQEFIDFAHALIDSGVDIIHGHSAHVFQKVERYKNGLIMYDTGDFVDDYAVDPILRNDQAILFLVTVSKSGIKKIEFIPLLISNMQVNLATGKDYEEIMEKIE